MLSFFYRFNLDFLIKFFTPFIGAASSVVVYFLGKKIFNSKVGLYSALAFSLIPIHILWSFRISTGIYGIFFLLLSVLFFWKGFEEGDNSSKILFGVFLALSLLIRYTMMWIIPIFLFYFLFRDKNLKFLKDKYLWCSILAFFIVLVPWFIYAHTFYDNLLGPFIHGTIGSGFWGGVQSSLFYFGKFLNMFSIFGIIFVISILLIFKKKWYKDKRIFFFLSWFIFFFFVASLVPHKEERFLLPLVPAVAILSGFFLERFEREFSLLKLNAKKIFVFLFIFLVCFVPIVFVISSQEITGTQICLKEGLDYISSLESNSLIYSDASPIVYAYTDMKTRYYPSPWNNKSLERGEENYILYTDYDKPLYVEENVLFREDLKDNFELVFSCDKDWGITEVYRIGN